MNQLTKTSNDDELRQYFNKVLELSKQQEQFPIDLNDVWAIAYKNKFTATRALKASCIEGIDYQPSQKGKVVSVNEIQNGVDVTFKISISCMEYLIARKIRPVFDVYRQVFHKTAEIIEQKASFDVPQSFAQALMLAAKQQEEIEEQQKQLTAQGETITALEGKVQEMSAKVDYMNVILNNPSTMVVTQIAQDYGMSAVAFNNTLASLGIQHKVNGQWILYSKYMTESYVQSKPVVIGEGANARVKLNTEWTQKGRIFLYNILKENKIIPLIEK